MNKLHSKNRAPKSPVPKSKGKGDKKLDISDKPPFVSMQGIVSARIEHAEKLEEAIPVPNLGTVVINGGYSVLVNSKVEVNVNAEYQVWLAGCPVENLRGVEEFSYPYEPDTNIRSLAVKYIVGKAIEPVFMSQSANNVRSELALMQSSGLNQPEEIKRFIDRFPVLYHTVPKQYEKTFQQGKLLLSSAADIRKREEAEGGDIDEGQFGDRWNFSVDKYGTFDLSMVREFWLFCLSKNPNIADEHRNEPMETYEVDVAKLLSEKMRVSLPDNLATIWGEAGKSPSFSRFGDEVEYTEEMRRGLFHKNTKWAKQKEIRIVIKCVDFREGQIIHPILTANKLKAYFPPAAFRKLPRK